MTPKRYLVTGGTGFLGAAVVKRLVREGHTVRVLDNNLRGETRRLADVKDDVELLERDVRDAASVAEAICGVDGVFHLAFINGTEFFYSKPELVLEVGVKGITNVIDGCLKHGVGEIIVASSSEVYQLPPRIPTDETAPLIVPDPTNPRFSYSGAKIISELMAINFGRSHLERVLIFRPHNIYGPDMGVAHVIPEFVLRLKKASEAQPDGVLRFSIQGTGEETRAFTYIDDLVDGLMIMCEKGEHLGIYHIGTMEEVTIARLARRVAAYFGREIEIVPGPLLPGSTPRRCPDISKLAALGFVPKIPLVNGVQVTARWYDENARTASGS